MQRFVPAESKLEAVVRISNLTGSGPEELGPGSKERKSVLINLAKGFGLSVDTNLNKPDLGEAIANQLGIEWDASCYSTGHTITLEGLERLLQGGEEWLVHRGQPVAPLKREFSTPKDEAAAILAVLTPVISEKWDGRSCVTEMRESEDRNWRQDKWAGWYFEYLGLAALIAQLGGAPRKFVNTSFDHHLASVWDLKAHSENTKPEAILNAQDGMRQVVEEGYGVGFVILSGRRVDDDGAFREWHRQERRKHPKFPERRVTVEDETEDSPSSRGISTVEFQPTRIEVFHIPNADAFEEALAEGVLKSYAQGRQPSGEPRKPKYKLMLDRARETILVDAIELGAEPPSNRRKSTPSSKASASRPAEGHCDPCGEKGKAIWQYSPEWWSRLWGIPV